MSGQCLVCGCTEEMACEGGCEWTNEERTLCNPDCVEAAAALRNATSVITGNDELVRFLNVADIVYGDPAGATCLLFVRWWSGILPIAETQDLLVNLEDGSLVIRSSGGPIVAVRFSPDGPQMKHGALAAIGVKKIAPGLWALSPSLNIPGAMHGYVVMHGVPEPAPWEQRVVLATSMADVRLAGGR